MIKGVDLRFMFDSEEFACVIGCHSCEQYEKAAADNIPEIVRMLTKFGVTHIKSCGEEIGGDEVDSMVR